jgi:ElaB/YqjD/DUF883 family membrane-anchored ribosome-binding protein
VQPPERERKTVDKAVKLDQLIDDAEELLTRLADAHDPQIQYLRDRVDEAIGDARKSITRAANDTGVQILDVARTVDDYVRDYPWLAVGTGVLLAGTVAFLAGVTIGAKRG